jgi:hypothetical protein
VKSKRACERCGAPIEWVMMRHGERVAVDAAPVLAPEHIDAAILATAHAEGEMTDGRTLRETAGEEPGLGLFLPHRVTCRAPDRDEAPRAAGATRG